MTAEESLLRSAAVGCHHGDDHDVRVECAHGLHTHELETQRAIRELLDGSQCCICSDTQVTERAGDAFRLPGDALALKPLELDFGTARSGWRAVKDEVGEPK